ncbi:recombinase family protein [Rhizobium sp. C4]|uniref:recombinase family protein n=1 Tax=Rhizobium sp. C4 TaxID=1349800 RepID=UPI001E34D2D3|nr:recombinase family protein [Rhizobium sp. C4]MCD2172307.1 recombinase family protein [Rhizobium sp. C4]
MKFGYARVSTEEQNLDLQLAALNHAECSRIFTDHGLSGKNFERPGLMEALETVKNGDKLVVWRLDRLGRSLPHLIAFVDALARRNAEFQSLTENIDTSSSGGRLIFHIMGALAEFERSLISERTRAGMEAARRRGSQIGRRSALTPTQIHQVIHAVHEGTEVQYLANQYGVSPRTIRNYLKLNSFS